MNKKVLIGLGVLAVAGIGLYMWKRRKDGEKSKETKSNARGFMASATCPCYDKNGNYLGYDNENCCTIIETKSPSYSNARGFMASATCPCYDKNGNYLGYDNENCCTIIETKSPSYSNARGFVASKACPCYDKDGKYLGYDNENCCTIIETKSPSYSGAVGGFGRVGRGGNYGSPLGKVKYATAITNTKQHCPAGSHSVTLPDGSFSCIYNNK